MSEAEKLAAALHEARIYGIGATSDHSQKIILEAAAKFFALSSPIIAEPKPSTNDLMKSWPR